MKPIGLKISGTGAAFPDQTVDNPSDTDQWIKDNLGIARRHHLFDWQTTSDLAVHAARRALGDTDPLHIDLILVATSSPDRLAPATATRVQQTLGASRAAAFDLNAVCSGWLYGLTIAAQFLDTSNARKALIIGADTFSRFTDWENRDSVFFGDGAGAALVERGEGQFWSHIRSDGEGWDSWSIPGGAAEYPDDRPIWEMIGRNVYDRAVEAVPDVVRKIVTFADYDLGDIDWFVPHQASLKVLAEITDRLDIPWAKVATNLWDRGNTASASIPTALDKIALHIEPGDLVCFAAVGAGWTWGAGLLEWT